MRQLGAPWRIEYIERPKDEGCFFCEGLERQRDRETLILHRGERSFIMMNRYPYTSGHLMVAPLEHIACVEDLSAGDYQDLCEGVRLGVRVLKETYHPGGFNIGMNLGACAGAGILDHLHFHVVPRWEGDTNFMPLLAEVKVMVEHLQATYDRLKATFTSLKAGQGGGDR